MTDLELEAVIQGISDAFVQKLKKELTPLRDRIEALEQQLQTADGKSVRDRLKG